MFTVDWGEEHLSAILDTLREYQVKATFFPTGQWASRHPNLLKRIADEGHEIGNHGYSHPHPDKLSVEENKNKRDIKEGEKIISKITGVRPRLYSPPYGECNPKVLTAAQELGYKLIMWTINPGDYLPGTRGEDILNTVLSKKEPGALVLLHPVAPTAKILPTLIQELQKNGYNPIPVSELLPKWGMGSGEAEEACSIFNMVMRLAPNRGRGSSGGERSFGPPHGSLYRTGALCQGALHPPSSRQHHQAR